MVFEHTEVLLRELGAVLLRVDAFCCVAGFQHVAGDADLHCPDPALADVFATLLLDLCGGKRRLSSEGVEHRQQDDGCEVKWRWTSEAMYGDDGTVCHK